MRQYEEKHYTSTYTYHPTVSLFSVKNKSYLKQIHQFNYMWIRSLRTAQVTNWKSNETAAAPYIVAGGNYYFTCG